MPGTQATQSMYAGFAGFDVSKDSVCLHHRTTGRTETIPNRPAELRRAARSLPPGTLCVCEPTGGHERLLLRVLREEGLPCHRADARKVKAYIRSLGIHGKTDAIDAKALARCGERRHADLAPWAEPDGRQDELRALDARRRDLVRLRTAEKNRSKAPGAKGRIAGSCKRMPALIEDELREIGGAMDALIAASGDLSRRRDVITSLKGVGAATANTLIASMPELGTLTGKQAASLAGVAPHPRQSGKRNAYRRKARDQTGPLHGRTRRRKTQPRTQAEVPALHKRRRQKANRRKQHHHAEHHRHPERQSQGHDPRKTNELMTDSLTQAAPVRRRAPCI